MFGRALLLHIVALRGYMGNSPSELGLKYNVRLFVQALSLWVHKYRSDEHLDPNNTSGVCLLSTLGF